MKRILIVDDDARARRFLQYILDEAGYEVAEASGGAEALAMVETYRPDLVVTDVIMPGTDGVAVSGDIRLNHPDLPVLAISASSSEVAEALSSGADRMLLKPFGRDELLAAIEDLMTVAAR